MPQNDVLNARMRTAESAPSGTLTRPKEVIDGQIVLALKGSATEGGRSKGGTKSETEQDYQ
jgi:hypothetical protein